MQSNLTIENCKTNGKSIVILKLFIGMTIKYTQYQTIKFIRRIENEFYGIIYRSLQEKTEPRVTINSQ